MTLRGLRQGRRRRLALALVSMMAILPIQAEGSEPEKGDGHFSLYVLGSNPKGRNLRIGSEDLPNTSVGGGIGAGLKVAYFPAFTKKILGLEVDYFGHGGDVVAPRTTQDGVSRAADANLTAVNAMINLIARYPGQFVQPYVGVGGGTSLGFLTGINFQSGAGTFSGNAFNAAWAYQFLGGVRANVTQRFFLFGEYRLFAARYKWDSETPAGGSGPQIVLGYHTHLMAGGAGIRF